VEVPARKPTLWLSTSPELEIQTSDKLGREVSGACCTQLKLGVNDRRENDRADFVDSQEPLEVPAANRRSGYQRVLSSRFTKQRDSLAINET
jgi:hypothetical protein